jgi:N-acetylmuramoyl-L-alanine amidase
VRRLIATALAALVAVAVAGCSSGDDGRETAATAAPDNPATTVGPTTTAPPTTTTTTPPPTTLVPDVDWPDRPSDGAARAIVTSTGIVLPVTGLTDDGYLVKTPCDLDAVVPGTPLAGAHVVLDPGHGGEEPGAVGANGLTEAAVNLTVAEQTAQLLQDAGATVVLTRTADYRITLRTRAAIATALEPEAFVSIHHNAEPDGAWPGPGTETYFQIADAESRRLAGLLWEEEVAALGPFDAEWVADTDAGAKYRPASDGGDYYGILRRSAGVPAVLSEAAFISNPTEAALLATPEFQHAEALAIARAVARFVGSDDPGSGFVEPYPRTEPAGSGGGTEGCDDPPLG